jgi:hypothetical protein
MEQIFGKDTKLLVPTTITIVALADPFWAHEEAGRMAFYVDMNP